MKTFDKIPKGWKVTEGAQTAPAGYVWINNGKSRFGGEYEQALLKTDQKTLHEKWAEDEITIIEEKTGYKYGMRLRGFSPGCQPLDGLTGVDNENTGKYHSILYYDRKLTDKEVEMYELDFLGEEV